MRVKDAVGAYGEQLAAEFLEHAGMTILERNWHCSFGEVDIVAAEGDTIVICEVKTRRGLGFGSGLEAVTRDKKARLYRLGLRWLSEARRDSAQFRVDAISVLLPRPGSHPSRQLAHQRDAPALIDHVRGVQ